ncbi:hypothetical protein SH591_02400 [Sphingomonas sp. LY54]|uniref:hypothetical protein n=1 Tax=Sphingomonas sp. LY54 TaxID=3095343 RepID=UPI002D77112E|nr:hypothetical protein [Sphingomonas sp. LY54]WRP29053.1 hypothetical protein SH591_02400 [Sphingomonas sp. LY54]
MILLYFAAVQAAAVSDGREVVPGDSVDAAAEVVAEAPAAPPVRTVRLAQDTPVELMAVAEVSTADVTPGTVFKLRVNRAVTVDGQVVIPVGTPAFGEVISASDSGGLGKSGKMTARLLRIRLGEADIPLEGEMSAKGTGAGSAGVAILFAGVAGFFHRGNNAKIKAGEILAGFIGEDVLLDLSSGPARRVAAAAGEAPAAPVQQ